MTSIATTGSSSAGRAPVSLLIFVGALALVIAGSIYQISGGYFSVRQRDLGQIRAALEAFHRDNGFYPKAPGVSVGSPPDVWDKRWLPGLSPKYMDVVPRDPRRLSIPSKQYLYISDGTDYKLIAHNPEDFGIASRRRPDMVDPARATYAYGFWSEGASKW